MRLVVAGYTLLEETADWSRVVVPGRAARARPRRRRARRRPARGGRRGHALPGARRAHRLPRPEAQAATDDRRGRAGCRRASRSTAARSSPPGSTASSSSRAGSWTADGREHLVRTGPWARDPAPRDPPRPRRERGLLPRPAARPAAAARRPGAPADADVIGSIAALAGLARRGRRRATTSSPATPSRRGASGSTGDLFASPRLDNLTSVHAGPARDGVDRDRRRHRRPRRVRPRGGRLGEPLRRRRPAARRRAGAGERRARRRPRGPRPRDRRLLVLLRRRRARRAPEPAGEARPREPARRGRRAAAEDQRRRSGTRPTRRARRCGRACAARPTCRGRSSSRTTTSRAARRSARSPPRGSASAPSTSARRCCPCTRRAELCHVDDPGRLAAAAAVFLRRGGVSAQPGRGRRP